MNDENFEEIRELMALNCGIKSRRRITILLEEKEREDENLKRLFGLEDKYCISK